MMRREKNLEQIHNVNQFADNIIPKKWCFDDRELEAAVVPRNVRRIEDWAFSHCRRLTEVWLPKALVSVGQGVFEGCERLRRLVVYEFTSGKNMEKCRMVLERLGNGKFLGNSLTFPQCLSSHEAALIALFLSLKEQAYSCLKLCGDLQLITKHLADRLLDELTEGCFTECRAYLLYYKDSVLNDKNDGDYWKI